MKTVSCISCELVVLELLKKQSEPKFSKTGFFNFTLTKVKLSFF